MALKFDVVLSVASLGGADRTGWHHPAEWHPKKIKLGGGWIYNEH